MFRSTLATKMKTLFIILLVGLGGMAQAEDSVSNQLSRTVDIVSGLAKACDLMEQQIMILNEKDRLLEALMRTKPKGLKIDWSDDLEEKYTREKKTEYFEIGFREDGVMVWRKEEKK